METYFTVLSFAPLISCISQHFGWYWQDCILLKDWIPGTRQVTPYIVGKWYSINRSVSNGLVPRSQYELVVWRTMCACTSYMCWLWHGRGTMTSRHHRTMQCSRGSNIGETKLVHYRGIYSMETVPLPRGWALLVSNRPRMVGVLLSKNSVNKLQATKSTSGNCWIFLGLKTNYPTKKQTNKPPCIVSFRIVSFWATVTFLF